MTIANARSGSETLATFGATTGQNLTAVFGGHAGTETVGALAFQNAGLKSSFHDSAPKPLSWAFLLPYIRRKTCAVFCRCENKDTDAKIKDREF